MAKILADDPTVFIIHFFDVVIIKSGPNLKCGNMLFFKMRRSACPIRYKAYVVRSPAICHKTHFNLRLKTFSGPKPVSVAYTQIGLLIAIVINYI